MKQKKRKKNLTQKKRKRKKRKKERKRCPGNGKRKRKVSKQQYQNFPSFFFLLRCQTKNKDDAKQTCFFQAKFPQTSLPSQRLLKCSAIFILSQSFQLVGVF